jgi:hypothetical protein|tara:strand:- start:333 stop:569 length:237 start_codon:yes stop_codon:yes gene_type:complete
MANKEMLKFHKMTEKEFKSLSNDKKRDKIQGYVSTINKQKREAVTKNISEKVEDARFRFKNPDKAKQRKALKKAGYLK